MTLHFVVKYFPDDEVMGILAHDPHPFPWFSETENVRFEPITKVQYETYIVFGIEQITLAQVKYRSDGYREK